MFEKTVKVALVGILTILFLVFINHSYAEKPLLQIEEDFSTDPGWHSYQNRMECIDCPEVIQDFGWTQTNFTGASKGEIGGRVDNSRFQAYYAMPLGVPLTFDDDISASGTLAVHQIKLKGVAYFGFFNPDRFEWRPWSSLAIRIWEEDMVGQVMFDWMSSDWQGRGVETAILLEPDGSVHSWSFHYEPDVRADPVWRDKLLQKHITDRTGNGRPYELQGEEYIFERVKQDEPDMIREELRERLLAVRDQGLVEYFHRHNQHRWWKRPNPEKGHGRITLQFDEKTPYIIWMDEAIRNAPVELSRFGLFNIQRYGNFMEVYFGDLTINGEKIDLSQDPDWEGKNNRARWIEPDFHAMMDFGFTETNWAGKGPGEIGGLFWRTETEDPNFAFYGDKVGELTLEDPVKFEGWINFVTGMTDAAMFLGYFNEADQTNKNMEGADAGFPVPNMLGISLADSTAVGYYFQPLVVSNRGEKSSIRRGPVFTPTAERKKFSFEYNPNAQNGCGQVVVSLGEKEYYFDLSADVRQQGAVFDHFGLMSVRRGGNSVEVYLDDLSYTSRIPKDDPDYFYKQEIIQVKYPYQEGGRQY